MNTLISRKETIEKTSEFGPTWFDGNAGNISDISNKGTLDQTKEALFRKKHD